MIVFEYHDLPFYPDTGDIVYVDQRKKSANGGIVAQQWRTILQTMQCELGKQFWYLPRALEAIPAEVRQWRAPLTEHLVEHAHGISSASLNKYLRNEANDRISSGLLVWTNDSIDRGEAYFLSLPTVDSDTATSVIIATARQLLAEATEYDQENEIMRSKWLDLDEEPDTPRKRDRPTMCAIERGVPDETPADRKFDYEVTKLLEEARKQIDALRARGVSQMVLDRLVQPQRTLSRILVTADWRIILPDFDNMEIEMRPLVKAVYLLFLCHPEGIRFKDLPDHRGELMRIYQMVRGGELTDKARQSIVDVTDPTKNSINEKCARIREAFLLKMEESLADYYIVDGYRAKPKTIAMADKYVDWENRTLLPQPQILPIRLNFRL
ncbi:MAG: hypothetical protein IJ724_13510 [Muribaculaceae bacterium]|nr:hypothetical protein [Muribaculaceae bacterium]